MTTNHVQKIAIYARTSTSDGKQNVETQLSLLRQYCSQRGFEIHKEYVDQMSGSSDKRPEYLALLADAKKRHFSAVIVYRFDRFARSTKMLIEGLEEFDHLGIDFISYSENIDTSSPMGKCMFQIISAFAELEKSVIRERVMSGLDRARKEGKTLGRPRVGFDVSKALKLREEGLGVRRIAKQLGVSYGTVYRTLKDIPQIQMAG
ncbi:DNA-invertase hin [Pontiella desulfatans]|uniref:DNA-invertase hin n=1 Tax=Pontiella desulfatans TaxID=2750659 RepID=A0A6C2UCX5_PONDE|nr:recombinase family protein [Pontiella desulfatans]VGO17076.1 DNA-invertase hin [Pontiella desulfatans]